MRIDDVDDDDVVAVVAVAVVGCCCSNCCAVTSSMLQNCNFIQNNGWFNPLTLVGSCIRVAVKGIFGEPDPLYK